MTTTTTKTDLPSYMKPVAYPVTDKTIADWHAMYMPLTIADINDREGFEAVHNARMTVKNSRTAVEKVRKDLKAGALEYGRAVDAEAKRITALLLPIEEHLEAEESRIVAEKERLKREKEEAERAIVQARVDALAAVGESITFTLAEALTEDQFQSRLTAATAAHAQRLAEEEAARRKAAEEEAERRRLAEEEAARQREEAARLAAEREELNRQRRQQEEEQQKLQEERERVAAEAREVQRQQELAKAREEAAERARQEERERVERQQEEERLRIEREELEAQRREAMKPDLERAAEIVEGLERLYDKATSIKDDNLRDAIILAIVDCQNVIDLNMEARK